MTSLYSKWARERYEQEQKQNAQEVERLNQMKLSEWLEAKESRRPNIFVDQDNTLLVLMDKFSLDKKGKWAKENATEAVINKYPVAILPRPGAKQFLKECKKIGNVYVLTAGVSHYQKQVLAKVGMLELVEDVFGRDNFHEVPQGRSILIDNLPHNHGNSVVKLQSMGGGMYIKVSDWEGDHSNDSELINALAKIHQAFAS
jgi:phosphoglycolate phosphatase-like HAD superfamily hydrolase